MLALIDSSNPDVLNWAPLSCRTNGSFPVQLIDWGQSAAAVDDRIIYGWQFYRPHPPERVLQLPASYPLDVWASAIVALHMLTGSGQFPDILNTTEKLAAYFQQLEVIAGCIPAYAIPSDWNHTSNAALHVQRSVMER